MTGWLTLITTLPTENATVRQRVWRSLKSSGAAVLRDGVYLLPELAPCVSLLDKTASEVRASGGTALVLQVQEPTDQPFVSMFDRGPEFAQLLAEVAQARSHLTPQTAQDSLKLARRLRKNWAAVCDIDFFPGQAQRQVQASLQALELAIARVLFPDEPQAADGEVELRMLSQHQGRTWATRKRPWVDRLACAWLIRRFIDPQAQIVWLESPADCPAHALGFDFEGATFSHVGQRVTFEVLLHSFSFQDAALTRLGHVVHYLDAGGVQPPEAAGAESILAGLRATVLNDDELLAQASAVFEGLWASFSQAHTDHDQS